MQPKLGIIAGNGQLPVQLARACAAAHRPYFIIALEGACDPATLGDAPHATVRLGAVGEALSQLRAQAVEEVVLAGGVKRPSMHSLVPDATGAQLIKKLGFRLFGGDDAILKGVMDFLENEGFRVIAAQDVLGEVLAEEGVLSARKPDAAAKDDIALGFKVAHAIGGFDIGQAVIVEAGAVLGVEGPEGTDALIARCALLQRATKRAMLIKAAKPGQSDRADLPTVGPETVKRLREAGMLGVAVEAGKSILLEDKEIARLCDEADMIALATR